MSRGRARDTEFILKLAKGLPDGNPRTLWRAYGVAFKILELMLGKVWVDRHIMYATSPTDFFKNKNQNDDRLNLSLHRITSLGEMLFNLRGVPGFKNVLNKLRDDDPESAYAELETGKLLFWAGVPFRFHEPEGCLGGDFDLEIAVLDHVACADTKCKIETTEPSEATLRQSLRKAQKQLPQDRPGIVFVRLPQPWLLKEGEPMQAIGERSGPVFELIRSATERFFRGTERVVAVYYYFAICLPGTDRSHMLNNIVLDSYLNPSHRFDTNAPWSKLLDDYSPHERGWIDILLLMDEGRGQWVTAEGKPLYICSVD